MFATGWAIGAASVLRTGVGLIELWSERVPALMKLGSQVREQGPAAGEMQGRFRDELIALGRESSEIAIRELRRGLDDLDAFTRGEDGPSDKPRRPYRAKP